MTPEPPSSIRSLDDVLDARASEAHARLQSEGQVLLDGRVMRRSAAERSERQKGLRDLWRTFEALIAITLITGVGYAIHLLILLIFQ